MNRYIGIRHRIKMTAEGKAKPTQLAIRIEGKTTLVNLKTEEDELEFALNKLERGDTIAMMLGGSGDYFAYALSRQAEQIGARVLRIPPFVFTQWRNGADKEGDATLLAKLAESTPELFYPVVDRDRGVIVLRESFSHRMDAMKARIACEQRIRARFIGGIFCSADGLYPEGGIEKAFDEKKANDTILQALIKEESARDRDLKKAAEALDIYQELFVPIEGCGPRIGAGLISSIIDIRRFETPAKLKKYCSVHVLPDGRFARRRTGEVANWSPEAREALFQLADQFNRRPGSKWGSYFIQMKKNLRAKHPEVVIGENGKKKYTDGHIHKMAAWRTLSRFVERLHRDWWRLEQAEMLAKKAA